MPDLLICAGASQAILSANLDRHGDIMAGWIVIKDHQDMLSFPWLKILLYIGRYAAIVFPEGVIRKYLRI